MAYSFGNEEKQEKGFVLFNTETGEQRFVPIRQLHPHRTVITTYDEIPTMEKELENCWLSLTVSDKLAGPELYSEMRDRFPYLAMLRGRSMETGEISDALSGEELLSMGDTDILKKFLEETRSLFSPTPEQLQWFEKMMLADDEEELQ